MHVNEESWVQFTNVTQAAAGLAEADWSGLVSLVVAFLCCVWFLNLRKASLGCKQCRWKAEVLSKPGFRTCTSYYCILLVKVSHKAAQIQETRKQTPLIDGKNIKIKL